MGMLFDHGCDAFVAIFNSFLLLRMFNIGTDPYQILAIMVAIFPFYFVTLEQYYTGEMNFPPINGVDEGSIVITGLAIITGIIGNVELWGQIVTLPFTGQKMPLGVSLKFTVMYFIYLYGLSGLVNIYKGRHLDHFKQLFKPHYFAAQVFFYFFTFFTMTMMQVWSPTEIWKDYPRTIGICFGFQIIYVVLRLQFSHILMA